MAVDQVTKAKRFRTLHEQDGVFIMPNPWDVGTARLLSALGFQALATTSAGHAYSRGQPDGAVAWDDMLAHCRALVDATDLPVSADLEKGQGDSPESVADSIRAAAATGLAGCSIEDHTGRRESPIYAFGHAVERIAAAAEAARGLGHDFVLTARSENFLWGRPDLDDTIRRLQAFAAAGADVLFAPGLRDLQTIRRVCESVDKPVNVVMGLSGTTFDVASLAEAGVKRISVGSSLARLAYGAVVKAAQEMNTAGTFTYADQAIAFADIERYF